MKNTLTTLIKYLSIASFSLASYNTINNKSINTITLDLENKRNKFLELTTKYQELLKNKLFDSELNNKITFEKLELLKSQLNSLQNKTSKQQNIIDNLDTNNTDNILNQLNDLSQTFQKSNNDLNSIVEIVAKYINSKNSNNFSISLFENLNNINSFIQNLTFQQNLAFLHISGSIFLLFAISSLFVIFYGDYFLTKWDIESKYPKLAIFIKIRRQFQNFYFLTNFLLSILVLLTIIFINIYIFTL